MNEKFLPLPRPLPRPHRVNVRLSDEERARAHDVIRRHKWAGVNLTEADALRIALMATAAVHDAREAAVIEAQR